MRAPQPGVNVGPMLELRAQKPRPEPRRGTAVVAARVPANLYNWVGHQADMEGISRSEWMLRLIIRERDSEDEGLPRDVTDWLRCMAAQQGYPGDTHAALLAVIRHLIQLYPLGARLLPDDELQSESLSTALPAAQDFNGA